MALSGSRRRNLHIAGVVTSMGLTKNRRHHRCDFVNDSVAAYLMQAVPDVVRRACHHDAVSPVPNGVSLARLEERIVLLIAEHHEDRKIERRQLHAMGGPERVD